MYFFPLPNGNSYSEVKKKTCALELFEIP